MTHHVHFWHRAGGILAKVLKATCVELLLTALFLMPGSGEAEGWITEKMGKQSSRCVLQTAKDTEMTWILFRNIAMSDKGKDWSLHRIISINLKHIHTNMQQLLTISKILSSKAPGKETNRINKHSETKESLGSCQLYCFGLNIYVPNLKHW